MSELLDIPTPSYRTQRPTQGMDPDMKRLGVIAGAIVGGLVVFAGAWSLTRSGAPAEVPVIHAPDGPLKVKPEDAGGANVIGAEEDDSSKAAASLAPAPETPELQALKARMDAAKAAEAAAAKSAQEAETAAAKAAQSARSAAAAPAPSAARVAAAEPAPVPTPAPAAAPQIAHPAPAALAPSARTAAAPSPAGIQVQLAAMMTEAAAHAEWARLAHRVPALFAHREPAVMRVDRAGKPPVWRLRTGGFADAAAARHFCESIQSNGGACAIATF